ncbi:peptide chain release factor 2 [bacterium]|nr:peptide chain release factor 2 [bacterium]MBT7088261.1 peptide chain release factor 2 [bacterium]
MKRNFIFWETIFEIPKLKEDIRIIETEIEDAAFWQDKVNTSKVLANLTKLKNKLKNYLKLEVLLDEVKVYLELLEEAKEEEPDTITDAQKVLKILISEIDALELLSFLTGKYDKANCIFSLNSGAGGTDAQDWTQMLFRMYTRFFEKKGYEYEVVEYTLGDEAGIKSATLLLKGDLVYGYLKSEIGVHRMVRLSPFNANNKRQTSFAAVDVIPEIENLSKNIQIDTKDLKIDTYRASGAGGQHVNKTDSAVRITHIPTGMVAQSQASRSQGANKEMAMKILTSRLVQKLETEHKEKVEELSAGNKEIAWGNQIRSYVFHPYQMVKDHRNNIETSNLQAVMDGDLDMFIEGFLRT